MIRESLSNPNNSQINLIIKIGLAPSLISLLEFPSERIKIEAAWSISNIAASIMGHCKTLIELNCHLTLLKTIKETNSVLLWEHTMWALANMAAEDLRSIKILIEADFLQEILRIFNTTPVHLCLVKVACWSMSAICKKYHYYDKIKVLLPYINSLLQIKDIDVLNDTLWTLFYITENPHPNVLLDLEKYIDIENIICHIEKPYTNVKTNVAIRILGNFCVLFEDFPTKLIYNYNILSIIDNIISFAEHEQPVADACWLLSNISIGPIANLRKISSSDILAKLCCIVHVAQNYRLKRDAIFAITNICKEATEDIILILLPLGVLECLTDAISECDPELNIAILEGIDNILSISEPVEGENEILLRFIGIHGTEKLVTLTKSSNEVLSEQAFTILDKFCNNELLTCKI